MSTRDQLDKNVLSPKQEEAATRELSRYFALIAPDEAEKFTMFSGAIDTIWHDLLKDEIRYATFLAQAGRRETVIHNEVSGFGTIDWIGTYHAKFGSLPEIWFTDARGQVNFEAWDAYRETGTVVSAWDCGPLIPDITRLQRS